MASASGVGSAVAATTPGLNGTSFVGMSFADLRKANGKPFYLSGFDDQRRGWVRDQWSPSLDDDDDKLGALETLSKQLDEFRAGRSAP